MKNTKKHLQKRIVKASMAVGTLALGMAIFSPAHAVFNPYFGVDVGLKILVSGRGMVTIYSRVLTKLDVLLLGSKLCLV